MSHPVSIIYTNIILRLKEVAYKLSIGAEIGDLEWPWTVV